MRDVSLDEKVDIDDARKQDILAQEAKLSSPNHFEFLGVVPGAPPEAITAAFREASKKFHPDRYYGKQLGSYKARLDKIFRRLVEAHSVLTDPQKRQAWLEANPALRASSGASPAPAREKTEDEKRRDAERLSRLARHPYLARATKVHDQLAKAREAIAKGEFSQAFTFLNQGQQMDPNNAEIRTLLAEVRQTNESSRADVSFKAGNEAIEKQDFEGAIRAFKIAVSARPSFHEAAHKAATLLVERGADAREIVSMAQKAVEAAPDNVTYRLFLGHQLEAAGMKALARKHFDEAARLAPNDPEVKKYVKKRFPF